MTPCLMFSIIFIKVERQPHLFGRIFIVYMDTHCVFDETHAKFWEKNELESPNDKIMIAFISIKLDSIFHKNGENHSMIHNMF